MLASVDPEVVAAVIAATASLVVAVATAIFSFVANRSARKAEEVAKIVRQADARKLDELKRSLDELQREGDARRDYRYDALKRLYSDVEPLLFQLRQASMSALERLEGIATNERAGNLREEPRWFRDGAYYNISTLYRLLVPPTLTELLRRKLTVVDLTLDPQMAREDQIAEAISMPLRLDFQLAAASSPALEYHPDDTPSGHGTELNLDPAHRRQGVYALWLEEAVEAMIFAAGRRAGVVSHSKFAALLRGGPEGAALQRMAYLLRDFDARSAPGTLPRASPNLPLLCRR